MSQEWLEQNLWLILLAGVWDLLWKGWALWKAARLGSKPWFVVLLLTNSLGILPIAYIFIFSKQEADRSKN